MKDIYLKKRVKKQQQHPQKKGGQGGGGGCGVYLSLFKNNLILHYRE